MTSSEFSSLSLENRLLILKTEADYIGTRQIPSHSVSLFILHGFYVELFVLRNLNRVQWIEVQSNRQIISEYVRDLDLDDLFS